MTLKNVVVVSDFNACTAEGCCSLLVVINTEDHICTGLLRYKCIGVLNANACLVEDIEDVSQCTRLVGEGCGKNVVCLGDVACLVENLLSGIRVITDKAEDTEILGVGDGEGLKVYTVIGKISCYFGELALFVFKENRDLLNAHGCMLLFLISREVFCGRLLVQPCPRCA